MRIATCPKPRPQRNIETNQINEERKTENINKNIEAASNYPMSNRYDDDVARVKQKQNENIITHSFNHSFIWVIQYAMSSRRMFWALSEYIKDSVVKCMKHRTKSIYLCTYLYIKTYDTHGIVHICKRLDHNDNNIQWISSSSKRRRKWWRWRTLLYDFHFVKLKILGIFDGFQVKRNDKINNSK